MYRQLSPREVQILTLLAEGNSRVQIGRYLGTHGKPLSQGAISSYIARAKAKLLLAEGEDSTAGLVARACAYGLVKPVFGKMSARDAARKGLIK